MGAEAAAGATEVDLAGGALAEDNGTLSHRSLGCHVYAQDSTCGRLYYAYTQTFNDLLVTMQNGTILIASPSLSPQISPMVLTSGISVRATLSSTMLIGF